MPTSLEAKLQTALQATTAITSLLASRADGKAAIYEMQENPGTTFPAITFMLISAVQQYSASQRMVNTPNRVQFTIWDSNPERARLVEAALITFFDSFNAYNVGDSNPRQRNDVVMRRQGGNPQTQPVTYWRIVDAMIWNNETI